MIVMLIADRVMVVTVICNSNRLCNIDSNSTTYLVRM